VPRSAHRTLGSGWPKHCRFFNDRPSHDDQTLLHSRLPFHLRDCRCSCDDWQRRCREGEQNEAMVDSVRRELLLGRLGLFDRARASNLLTFISQSTLMSSLSGLVSQLSGKPSSGQWKGLIQYSEKKLRRDTNKYLTFKGGSVKQPKTEARQVGRASAWESELELTRRFSMHLPRKTRRNIARRSLSEDVASQRASLTHT
jgi:hypothetical protein